MKVFEVLKQSFDLNRPSQSDFWRSEWDNNNLSSEVSIKYFVYRTLYMLTFVALVIYDLIQYVDLRIFLIYFTNWTLLHQTTYSILYFSRLVWLIISPSSKVMPILPNEDSDQLPTKKKLPCPEKFLWIIYNIVGTWPFIVTLGFWCLVFEPEQLTDTGSMVIHGTLGGLSIIDAAVVAIPVRKIHLVFPTVLGTVYVIFTCVYEACGGPYYESATEKHEFIYPFLNWKHYPKIAALMGVAAITFTSAAHTIFCWGFYRLRIFIKKTCCKKDQHISNHSIKPSEVTVKKISDRPSENAMHRDMSTSPNHSLILSSELSFNTAR